MSEDEKMLGSSAHPLGFPARTQRHKREEVRNKKYRRLFTPRRAHTHTHPDTHSLLNQPVQFSRYLSYLLHHKQKEPLCSGRRKTRGLFMKAFNGSKVPVRVGGGVMVRAGAGEGCGHRRSHFLQTG